MTHEQREQPYIPAPLTYLPGGKCIMAFGGQDIALEVRGWGYLNERYPPEITIEIQDETGKLAAAAYNSYARHFPDNAVEAAEEDVLGQALEALGEVLPTLETLYFDGDGEGDPLGTIRAILAKRDAD